MEDLNPFYYLILSNILNHGSTENHESHMKFHRHEILLFFCCQMLHTLAMSCTHVSIWILRSQLETFAEHIFTAMDGHRSLAYASGHRNYESAL